MKTNKKRIKMIVEKTETGFSAFSEEYPIFTTGRTITELIDNKAKREMIGNNARHHVEEHLTIDKMGNNFCQLYSEILKM